MDDVVANFDDFAVSTGDPRYVTISNLPGAGYGATLVDNLGNVVTYGTSVGTSLALGVVVDVVLGTGSDGRLYVDYPNGFRCLRYAVPGSDAVVGGDTYRLSWRHTYVDAGAGVVQAYIGYGSNTTLGPVFNITVYPGNTLYTYLQLDWASSSVPTALNLNISLISTAGASSGKIVIVNGVVVEDSTLPAVPLQGTGNYVLLEGYFTYPLQAATLKLYIVACSTPSLAVCYVTPVTVYLSTT